MPAGNARVAAQSSVPGHALWCWMCVIIYAGSTAACPQRRWRLTSWQCWPLPDAPWEAPPPRLALLALGQARISWRPRCRGCR